MPNCPHSLEIIHQDMRIEISHKASVLFLFTQVHGCAKWNKFIKFETSQIIQVSSSANNLFTTTRSALTLRFVSRQPSQVFSCPWGVTFTANMKKSRQWVILGKSRHAFHFMLFRTFFSFVLHLLTFVWVWDVFLSSTLDIEQSMASYRDQSSYKRPCCSLARSNLRLKILLWPTKVNKGMPL